MAILNDNGDQIDQTRDILFEIAEKTKTRINEKKKIVSLQEIKAQAQAQAMPIDAQYRFELALKSDEISFICEIKKASPSKGLIAPDFPYVQIAKDYQASGAAAISCLTEPFYFQGRDEYLEQVVANVSIPVLRKDFTVDEYMIYEAKVMGASAVLLICSILSDEQLSEYFKIADRLGLSVLVETHTADEVVRALKCGARIIGVNNRNLRTFEVSIQNSIELRKMVHENIVFVSESGIKTKEDIYCLYNNKVNAVLIGETLMRAENKKDILDDLRSLCKKQADVKIKICGIKNAETIEYLNEAKPDYIGFVFAKSVRQVSYRVAKALRQNLDKKIQAIGVFVNEDPQVIIRYLNEGVIDIAQLHGNESEDDIKLIKLKTGQPVIKAVSVKKISDILAFSKSSADYLLLDYGSGGTGKSFDWSILELLEKTNFNKPFFIAGGLNCQNVTDVLNHNCFGVDVSGGVETQGIKDKTKIQEFITIVRNNNKEME